MDAPEAPKEALRQGRDPNIMTEEEQVACAMQLSMGETGKGEAPANKNKKEGESPRNSHKGGDNPPGPQADQGEVPDIDPNAGVVEEPSEEAGSSPRAYRSLQYIATPPPTPSPGSQYIINKDLEGIQGSSKSR